MTNLPSIIEYIGLPQITAALSVILFLFALLFTCWRAKSAHPIIMRISRLAFRNSPVHDAEILQFIRSRDDLTQLIFISGIPIRTLQQGKRLIAWANRRDEDLSTIKTCGHFFDLEKFTVRKDKLGNIWIDILHIAFIIFFALAAGASLAFIAIPKAIGQMKVSDQWITATTNSVKEIGVDGIITHASCQQGFKSLANTSRLTPVEFQAICNSLGSTELEEFVDKVILDQRLTGLAGTILFLILASVFAATYYSKTTAQALEKRLKKYDKENITHRPPKSIINRKSAQ